MELISSIRQVIPNDIRLNLKLSKAFIVMQKPAINESWEFQRTLIEQHGIDEKLVPIAAIYLFYGLQQLRKSYPGRISPGCAATRLSWRSWIRRTRIATAKPKR